MEVILQLFKQLPPFWPRMAALVVLILLLALPQTRRILTRGGVGDRRLERAKRLLEVRKLQLEVSALRAAHPEGGESVLDAQIAGILAKPLPEYEEESPPLPWTERLKLSGTGGASFLLIGTVAAGLSGMREGLDLVMLAAKELLAVIPAVLVASAIPARDRWGPVFYGFLMPILIVALAVTARIRG